MTAVRVVLADDEEWCAPGCGCSSTSSPTSRWWGGRDGLEAVEVVTRLRPPSSSWTCGCRVRRDRGRPPAAGRRARDEVVVLTTFDEDASLAEALRAGVSGFLLKVGPARAVAARRAHGGRRATGCSTRR